jgi:hypothetical protein
VPAADTLASRIGEEIVLVHLETDRIFVLNRTAARVWELLGADRDETDIDATLREEFDVDPAALARDVEGVLATLRAHRLIEVAA